MEAHVLLLFLVFACIGCVSGKGPCHEVVERVDKRLMGMYVPQCKSDGNYKERQCHGSTGWCWCVDSLNGKEINGTRKGPTGNVKCDELKCGIPGLYFTNRSSILCLSMNSSSGLLIGAVPHKLADSTGLIRTIGLDPVNKNVFWGDLKYNKIHKMSLNRGEPRVLFSYAIGYVQGLAVDWTSNNLYWTDSLMKMVELSDTNGLNRKVMFKLHGDAEPRGIFVDPKNGYLFWTDWGSEAKIERSSLSGADRKTIVSSSIKWPNDLAVDHTSNRLYWVDAYYDVVESVTLDGDARKVIYKMTYKTPHAYSMAHAVAFNVTYWTDWLSNSIYATSKEKFGATAKLVYRKGYKYKSIGQVRVLEDFSDTTISTPCLSVMESNNKCSHLCLRASKNEHVCDCPTGQVLSNTSSTKCEPAKRSYEIYFADSHEQNVNHLVKYDKQDGFTIQPLVMPSNERLKYPIALDFDPYDGYIYWTDWGNSKTYRMHENHKHLEVVLKSTPKASSGIAVHKISKVIFYFSMIGKQMALMMSCVEGHYTKTIHKGKFIKPRDIAISEDDGIIFFTDYNCVGRMNMDGTGFRCLRGKGGVISYPIGLAVDKVEKRLYWCDSVYYSITSIDFDLNEKSIHLVIQKTLFHRYRFWLVVNLGFVLKPHSMAILGEKIFWTDLRKKAIYHADKRGGSNIEYVTGGLAQPKDLHVYSDKVLTEHRKIYKLSFFVKKHDRKAAFCVRAKSTCLANVRFADPAPCPHGYRETQFQSACANCSDAFGGNFKCLCKDWKTCAQRAYGKVKGCLPNRPFLRFKVRECVQTVKPGVCSYKALSTCPQSEECLSDDNCDGDTKCCETGCGKKCSPSVPREDNPCTVNKGGCSHFCISKPTSYECVCPDGMTIDNNGRTCVHINTTTTTNVTDHLCMLPRHLGSCHSHNPMKRWFHNETSRRCEEFSWGGCTKNRNNFPTKEDCDKVCERVMDCNEEKKVGPCKAAITHWYYRPDEETCESFVWGGCEPGGNNFKTEKECMQECKKDHLASCKCQHGGTCSLLDDGYSTMCNCMAPWYGKRCSLNAEKGVVTVTFQRFDQIKFTKEELQVAIADMLKGYCDASNKCHFLKAKDGPLLRKRRDSHEFEFEFTAENIVIQKYVITKQTVIVTFVVVQPGHHDTILSAKSLQESFNSKPGRRVGRQFGISPDVTLPPPKKMGSKRPHRKSATPAIVLTLIVAALLVAIAGYVYYRKKEMARRAATVISPRSPRVDGNGNIIQRAYNNCNTFFSNVVQNVRLRDRLPNVARESSVTHTAFENELYDDVMHPVDTVRPHPHTAANNNEEPIQSVANPAYVSQAVHAGSPLDSPPHGGMVSTPNMTNLQNVGPISENNARVSSESKPNIDDWVQFTDTGNHVMGPGFNDTAHLDLQYGDPYNIDPGSPPGYSSRGVTPAGPETSYTELPRYSELSVREPSAGRVINSPSLTTVDVNANQQHVQFATIPVDSTDTATSNEN